MVIFGGYPVQGGKTGKMICALYSLWGVLYHLLIKFGYDVQYWVNLPSRLLRWHLKSCVIMKQWTTGGNTWPHQVMILLIYMDLPSQRRAAD